MNRNIKKEMKISTSLVLSHGILLMVILLITVMLFRTISDQEYDAVNINYSGRQRMLSQKITKEIILFQIGKIEKQQVNKSMTVFEQTLLALKDGGEAPADLEMKTFVTLHGAKDSLTLSVLKEVEDLWEVFKLHVNQLFSGNQGYFDLIIEENLVLLGKMNEATGLMQKVTEKKTADLRNSVIIGFLFGLVIFVFALFISRNIVLKLNRFLEIFGKGATGDLTQRFILPPFECQNLLNRINETGPALEIDEICFLSQGTESGNKEVRCPLLKKKKFTSCKNCPVYKKSCYNEIASLGLWFNHFMNTLENSISVIKGAVEKNRAIGNSLSGISELTGQGVEEILMNVKRVDQKAYTLDSEIHTTVSAIEEITASIGSMDQSIEKQAAALSQSSASIEQIAATIQNISQGLHAKKVISRKLSDETRQGTMKMDELRENIETISSSINSIFDLLEVINTITEQTGLLALNAAIEAAQAGIHGRGFAVVADEISKLSELTSENAKTINSTLKEQAENIRQGDHTQKEVSRVFSLILSGIKEVVQALDEASTGVQELSLGSSEVVSALSSLRDVSDEVKKGSGEIITSAEYIRNGMIKLSNVSGETAAAMNKVTTEVEEIRKSAEKMMSMGKLNTESICEIEENISAFYVGEE